MNHRILLFFQEKPQWLTQLKDGLLWVKPRFAPAIKLHEHPIVAYDADIDASGCLHIIAYSAMGLLIYYTVTEKGPHSTILARIQQTSQRLDNLQIMAKKEINLFYTVSSAPFLTHTLVHYRKGSAWSGKRVIDFPPNTKHLTVLADRAKEFQFYCTYSVLSVNTLKALCCAPDQGLLNEEVLIHTHTPFTHLGVCEGHYVYCLNHTVYCDGEPVAEGSAPMLIHDSALCCLLTRQDKQVVYQKDSVWQQSSVFDPLPLCQVRGQAPFRCSLAPFTGFEDYHLPLSTGVLSIEARLNQLERQVKQLTELLISPRTASAPHPVPHPSWRRWE